MFSRNYERCACMNNYNLNTANNNVNNSSCEETIYDNSCNNIYSDNEFLSDCSCGFNEPYNTFPQNVILGQSYVPNQQLNKVYKKCIGLKMGSLFPELVNTYEPCQSMEENEFLRKIRLKGEVCNKCQ